MFFPIVNEQVWVRRVAVVTIGLIASNILAFLFTDTSAEQKDAQQLATLRTHMRMVAALAPELKMSPQEQQVVADFRDHSPGEWRQLQNPNRDVIDAFDARIRLIADDPAALQKEMDSLATDYSNLVASSSVEQYAFVPAHPSLVSYITANFLHGGWLHLIFNMWFLWLAGVWLEVGWGPVLYPDFYLGAGIAALDVPAWANPGRNVPLVGA